MCSRRRAFLCLPRKDSGKTPLFWSFLHLKGSFRSVPDHSGTDRKVSATLLQKPFGFLPIASEGEGFLSVRHPRYTSPGSSPDHLSFRNPEPAIARFLFGLSFRIPQSTFRNCPVPSVPRTSRVLTRRVGGGVYCVGDESFWLVAGS